MVEGGDFAQLMAKLSSLDKRKESWKGACEFTTQYKLDCTPFIAFLIYLLGPFLSFVFCHHVVICKFLLM